MNLEPTPEQAALRTAVRRHLRRHASVAGQVRPLPADPTDPAGATWAKDDVWQGLAELGTTGLLVPAEHGGAGAGMAEAGVVAEELGAVLYPGPWLSSAVAAPRALVRAGTGSAAATLLAGLAEGTTPAAVALPRAPADLPTARSRGDSVRLRGETEVPEGAAADVLLVPAAETGGTGLFAVRAAAAGVVVTPVPGIDPTRRDARVTLADTPAERLGSLPPSAVEALVDDVLIASSADALGAAAAVLDLALAHARTRRQFGRPIGAFQAVAHLCVEMYETVELARGGVMHALWAADAACDAERHVAALRAKAFAGRLATVGDGAVQVLGGIGYTWEHDAHLYLRRLLAWSAFRGSPDRYLQDIGVRAAVRTHPGGDHR